WPFGWCVDRDATDGVDDCANRTNAAAADTAEGLSSVASRVRRVYENIAYARGGSLGSTWDPTSTLSALSWISGDPLHSRPAVINYGNRGGNVGTSPSDAEDDGDWTRANPDIRILIGGNDGVMRMVQNTSPDCTPTSDPDSCQLGRENWAFIPQEVVRWYDVLRINPSAPPKHPSLVDGAPVPFLNDADGDGAISINYIGVSCYNGGNVVTGNNGDGTLTLAAQLDPPQCERGVVRDRDANPATADPIIDRDYAWVFFGLRRGGKAYYAVDVTFPYAPRLLWKISKTSGGDFDELAQSWSTPKIGKILIDKDGPSLVEDPPGSGTFVSKVVPEVIPVVLFGGGYNGDDYGIAGTDLTKCADMGKDAANRGCSGVPTDDDEGNAIYMVDARDGTLIWKVTKNGTAYGPSSTGYGNDVFYNADMVDSIPSDLAVADTDGDGFLDRIYVGDTGGTLWRADIGGSNRSRWFAYPVMAVGRHALGPPPLSTPVTDYRRFFNTPDVVLSRDETGAFDGVILGSGDREDPTDSSNDDWMYLYKDRRIVINEFPVSPTGVDCAVETDFFGACMTALAADYDPLYHHDLELVTDCILAECVIDDGVPASSIANGWKFDLANDATSNGEKVLAEALTVGGNIFFTTYIPGVDSSGQRLQCAPVEGGGRFYGLRLSDAGSVLFNLSGTDVIPYEGLAAGG
ncbi:MAG: pilus assembly protein, partial [Planctomycetota bacterium]